MFTFSNEEIEANQRMRLLIEGKLDKGLPLTKEEQYFFCNNIHWEIRSTDPLCEDVFYHDAFIYRKEPTFGPYKVEYTPDNERRFRQLVDDWGKLMTMTGHTDTLMQSEHKELNKELKALNKQFKSSDPEYNDTFFKLIAWSKFRFLLIKKIFEFGIKGDSYRLSLNGQEIFFDYESCNHILARHFGHGMKPYASGKDHFYGVFRHTHLHLDFEQIFKAIDESGLYVKDSILDITFRYKGEVYKMYIVQEKGSTKKRISTFFPVSDPSILNALASDYIEKRINNELSIFVKK